MTLLRKTKDFLKNSKLRVAVLCYALALLWWLGSALFFLIGDATRPEMALDPTAAQLENMVRQAPGLYATEGADPQMIFAAVDARARTLRLEADFARAPGEMELFYTRKAGQGFSAQKRVVGVPQNDGSVLYSLPPGHVQALRLDPGSGGSNRVAIHALTLNPAQPAWRYFVPTLRGLLAFLVVPALALCLIYAVLEMPRSKSTASGR